MPNMHSKAQHTPQRTCVVCRTPKAVGELISFFVLPQGIVFDPQRRVQRRRNYVCQAPDCLRGLDKWKRNHMKRRFAQASKPIFSPTGTS